MVKNPVIHVPTRLDISVGFHTQQIPKEVCCNASEEIDFLARVKQAGKKKKQYFPRNLCMLLEEGMVHMKSVFLFFKRSRLKMRLPSLNDLVGKVVPQGSTYLFLF